MGEFEFSGSAQQWVMLVLMWVGFGTLIGLLARALIPGREPGGAVGTVFIGIVGSALGPLVLSHYFQPEQFNPVSPLGFLAAIAAALALLIAFRLAGACLFVEQEEE